MKKIEGRLDGKGLKIAIVVSRFNEFITTGLLEGALDVLDRHGVDTKNIEVVWTPGAFEIPLVAKKLAAKKMDAIIALGAVIRGDTSHFDYVAAVASKGIAQVSLETGVPIAFGVLTTDTVDQALERSGIGPDNVKKVGEGKKPPGNKGAEAAETAIEMANLLNSIN